MSLFRLRKRARTAVEIALALPQLWAPQKTFVVVLCSMRSGSTLLNALLAQAPDVSHLPEVRWDDVLARRNRFDRRAENLSAERIIVLKSPPWFTSTARDKRIADFPIGPELRVILLARDVYSVVTSLKRRMHDKKHGNDDRFIRYWCEAYESACTVLDQDARYVRLVRYEDLTARPVAVTKDLFEFIGSQQQDGVDRYSPPQRFPWSWGKGDASEKIKSLQVQSKPISAPLDEDLVSKIAASERVVRLRARFGYHEEPTQGGASAFAREAGRTATRVVQG